MPKLKIIDTLLSCPFCGGEAVMTKAKADAAGTRYVYRVSCTDWSSEKCSCSPISKWYDTKEEAEEGWNRRAVKRGKWFNPTGKARCETHCTHCNGKIMKDQTGAYIETLFCPHCGADMRGENDDN